MIVWNCNPLVTVPNAELIRRGLERDDLFTVVHEQFLTDTARYADIVLPATTQIESDDVVLPWGHLWVGWNEAAIEPLGESCQQHRAVPPSRRRDGLHRAGLFDDDDDPAARRARRRSTSTSCAASDGCVCPYPDDGRPFGDGVFPTASGQGRVGQRTARTRWANRACRRSSRRARVRRRASCSRATRCSC